MQKELEKQLQTRWMGKKVFYREETESTITWAKEAAKAGSREELDGALFLAEAQTGGKGRMGRVWTSPPGQNIYMNLLLMEPEISPMNAASLTLVMGLSVAQAATEVTGKKAWHKSQMMWSCREENLRYSHRDADIREHAEIHYHRRGD